MSREKIFPSACAGRHRAVNPLGRQQRSSRLLSGTTPAVWRMKRRARFYIDQFNNEANPLAHATTTAPELFEQLDGDIDAVVVGVGSGGTTGGFAGMVCATFAEKPNLFLPILRDRFWRIR